MPEKNLEDMSAVELIELYPKILEQLKKKDVIRSKNLIGDIGEYLVISHYCKTAGLSNLQRAPPSTMNIDAISADGERYSIKSTSTNATGTFWGLNTLGSEDKEQQKFEYLAIAIFSDNYVLKKIVEIDWNQFLQIKKWHSRMNAWYVPINSKLNEIGRVVFPLD